MRSLKWIGGLLAVFVVIRILALMIPVPIDITNTTELICVASFFVVAMLLVGGYTVAAFKAVFGKH